MSVFNLFETNFRMFFLNYFFSHKYNDSNVYFRHSDARLHVFFFFIFQNRVRFHCSFFILFRSALVWCRAYFSISSIHIIIFSFLSASVKVHSILNERKKKYELLIACWSFISPYTFLFRTNFIPNRKSVFSLLCTDKMASTY